MVQNSSKSNPPVFSAPPQIETIATLAVIVLMVASSMIGLIIPQSVYPTQHLIDTFKPNDWVNLGLLLPALVITLWSARRGALLGALLWPGALFAVFYTYTVYLFALPFNIAFLFNLPLVTIAGYTMISLVTKLETVTMPQRFGGHVAERLGAGALIGFGVLFVGRALVVATIAIMNGIDMPRTEMGLHTADALVCVMWVVGGFLLWQRRPLGYVLGVGLLFQASLLMLTLIFFLLFQPLVGSGPLLIEDLSVVGGMSLLLIIPFGIYIFGIVKHETTPLQAN